ncbi:Zn-dependent protease with chaperone function [Streptomyces sp. 840.1]|uniref:M48 family metalloprotease n=1 Tax=Streptomyces sp. 840.1 TaxID=2485152 RepID=UPI000F497122|nr:M48 family metalloprotease [Streptomyces sp. 840.1]ROQ69374.1 Zn-dependent protease with chaperone function [Streptomyces sp. 840.1]
MAAAPGPGARPRIDERVLGAGTGPRFVTLLLLMLTTGGAMILAVFQVLAHGDQDGCSLAAGVDLSDGSYWNPSLSTSGQMTAARFCLSLWAPAPPWWQIAGWPLVLMVAAGLLFAVLPRWKARQSRVVPLDAVDQSGELGSLIRELCAVAGVSPMPRFVVDPAATSVGAVVFGRTRRPVVCLHGGLLVVRRSDPERFRAVLLHELAHIANRDVTLTYLTVALWRVFLGLVLLPYLLCLGYVVYSVVAGGGVPRMGRPAVSVLVMVAQLYLARSDALRSREIYADLTAVRWGADPHGWSVTAPTPGGPVRRALDSFTELWRTHPQWGLRRGALADPAPLFRTAALPILLIGTVPALAVPQVLQQIAQYRVNFTNNLMTVLVIVPGALVTGVVVVALWRAVVYAVLTGTRVPSGAWVGGCLGAGMSAGLVLSGFGAGWAWLPQRPPVLLVPVAAGAAFGWWVTQCARLWTGAARGRTLRPALASCVAAASLAMMSWLTWWMFAGAANLNRPAPSAGMEARAILAWLPSGAPAGDLSTIPGLAVVQPQLDSIAETPMGALAVTVLWVVPLFAWASRPAAGASRWVPGRTDGPEAPAASLRKVLRPGLLGGALACLAVAGVQAYLHTEQPVPAGRGGLYAYRYLALLLSALCLPAAVAAAVASTADRRYRLLGALIAAQTTALLGLAAMTLLVSVDGCIAPLDVLSDSCAWRPAWRRPLFPFDFVLNNALVLSALAALLIALVTTSAATLPLPRRRRRPAAPAPGPAPAWGRRARTAVALLCAVALAGTATQGAVGRYRLGFTTNELTTQRRLVQYWGLPEPHLSDAVRVRQIRAWYRLSGDELINLAVSYDRQLSVVIRAAEATGEPWPALNRTVLPVCTSWGRAAWFETVWFRIPADPLLRADWHRMVVWADTGNRGCTQALAAHDNNALRKALLGLRSAARCAESVNTGIDRVLRAGGYPGTSRRAATGRTVVCDHPPAAEP